MANKIKLAEFYDKILKSYIKYEKNRKFDIDDINNVNDNGRKKNYYRNYYRDVKKNIKDILKPIIDKNINVYLMNSFEDRLKTCTVLMRYCMNSLLERLSPNSIILKIGNFKSFLNATKDTKYVTSSSSSSSTLINFRVMEDFLKEDLNLIIKKLKSCDKSREIKKIKKDPKLAILAEDVERVLKSSYYKNGWSRLLNFSTETKESSSSSLSSSSSSSHYHSSSPSPFIKYSPSKLRDILIFQLIVTTSTRSGVISNLTMREYDEMEKLLTCLNGEEGREGRRSNNDLYLLKCCTHKTSSKYGEAHLFLTPTMKEGLDSYVKFIRPLLLLISSSSSSSSSPPTPPPPTATTTTTSTKEIQYIFITDKGEFFSPQSVYNSMKRLAERCGLKKKFTTSRNRKGTTTENIESQPHLKKKVCNMMCHSEKVADTFYRSHARVEDLKNTFCQTLKGKSLIYFSKNYY